MRTFAPIGLAALVIAAAALGALTDPARPPAPPSSSDGRAVVPPAPARAPAPPRLGRSAIDRQDRSSAGRRARESRVFEQRALLTLLPLKRAGVRIDIAGLAADAQTTILAIDPGARSRAHAHAVYAQALARHRDTGRAYALRWAR